MKSISQTNFPEQASRATAVRHRAGRVRRVGVDRAHCPSESSKVLSFEELCALEPKLLDLYEEARAIQDDLTQPYFCANEHWKGYRSGRSHGGLRAKLVQLVGWAVKERGGDPRLATSQAYDVAYRTVYNALPDCRKCICLPTLEVILRTRARR